jgi:hypothetical protein
MSKFIAHVKQPGVVVHVVVHETHTKVYTTDGYEVFNMNYLFRGFQFAHRGAYIGYLHIPMVDKPEVVQTFVRRPRASLNTRQSTWVNTACFSAFDYIPLANYISEYSPVKYEDRYYKLSLNLPQRNGIKLLKDHVTRYPNQFPDLMYIDADSKWTK